MSKFHFNHKTLLQIGDAIKKEHELADGNGDGIFVQSHTNSIGALPWYNEEWHSQKPAKMGCLYFWKKTSHYDLTILTGRTYPASHFGSLESNGFGDRQHEKSFYEFINYWRGLDCAVFDRRLIQGLINNAITIHSLTSKNVFCWIFYVPDQTIKSMFCIPVLVNDSIPGGKFFIKQIENSSE